MNLFLLTVIFNCTPFFIVYPSLQSRANICTIDSLVASSPQTFTKLAVNFARSNVSRFHETNLGDFIGQNKTRTAKLMQTKIIYTWSVALPRLCKRLDTVTVLLTMSVRCTCHRIESLCWPAKTSSFTCAEKVRSIPLTRPAVKNCFCLCCYHSFSWGLGPGCNFI